MSSYRVLRECPECGRITKRMAKHMRRQHPEAFIKTSFHGKEGATHPTVVEFRESLSKMVVEA